MGALGLFTLFSLVAVGVMRILSLRKRATPVSEPGCGRCGYPARGLPTFTCPECGSDLREVGIIRRSPDHRRKVLLVGLATLGAVVLAAGLIRLMRSQAQLTAVSATRQVQPLTVTPLSAQRVNPSQVQILAPSATPTRVSPGRISRPVGNFGSRPDPESSDAPPEANDNVDP